MCIVKDELLNHLHDDHPYVFVKVVHFLHEDGLVEVWKCLQWILV